MSQIGDTSVANAIFHVRAIAEIRSFPRPIRKRVGAAIWDLQLGRELSVPLSKPMPDVERGVHELRLMMRAHTIACSTAYTRSAAY